MKNSIQKVEDAKLQSLPQNGEFLVEKLDFSELVTVKGGGELPPVDPPKGSVGHNCSC